MPGLVIVTSVVAPALPGFDEEVPPSFVPVMVPASPGLDDEGPPPFVPVSPHAERTSASVTIAAHADQRGHGNFMGWRPSDAKCSLNRQALVAARE
jgi:hypothetical protein